VAPNNRGDRRKGGVPHKRQKENQTQLQGGGKTVKQVEKHYRDLCGTKERGGGGGGKKREKYSLNGQGKKVEHPNRKDVGFGTVNTWKLITDAWVDVTYRRLREGAGGVTVKATGEKRPSKESYCRVEARVPVTRLGVGEKGGKEYQHATQQNRGIRRWGRKNENKAKQDGD